MNKLFIILACELTAIIFAAGAVYMGINEISGWGWFILGSVLTAASVKFGKSKQNAHNS